MRRLLPGLLCCLIMLALGAPAAAWASHDDDFPGAKPISDPVVNRYLVIAAGYWQQPAPTCANDDGTVEQLHTMLYDDPDPAVAASAQTPGCVIYLDRDFWPTPDVDPVDCTIIVHEYGHLLGHEHSSDPNDVMYPTPTRGVPGCDALGAARPSPAAHRHRHKAAVHHRRHVVRKHRRAHRRAAARHVKRPARGHARKR